MEFLGAWSKNPAAYFKKAFAAQDETKSLKQADDEEEVEVGFVGGLFKMYKLRCDIAKASAELLADSTVSLQSYRSPSTIRILDDKNNVCLFGDG